MEGGKLEEGGFGSLRGWGFIILNCFWVSEENENKFLGMAFVMGDVS